MPRYDIKSFRKLVNEVKDNYKPERSTKICLLCNQALSEFKLCYALFEGDTTYVPNLKLTDNPTKLLFDSQREINSNIQQNTMSNGKSDYNKVSSKENIGGKNQKSFPQNNPWDQRQPNFQENMPRDHQSGYQQNRQWGPQSGYPQNRQGGLQYGYQQNRHDASQYSYQSNRQDSSQHSYQQNRQDASQYGYQQNRQESSQYGYQQNKPWQPSNRYQQSKPMVQPSHTDNKELRPWEQDSRKNVSTKVNNSDTTAKPSNISAQGKADMSTILESIQPRQKCPLDICEKSNGKVAQQPGESHPINIQEEVKLMKAVDPRPSSNKLDLEAIKKEIIDSYLDSTKVQDKTIQDTVMGPSREMVQPRKRCPLEICEPPKYKRESKVCPLEICTRPSTIKRKRPSTSQNSVSSEVKRRKKAEHVVITFSKIVDALNSAIETNNDPGGLIRAATESINENMKDYTNALHKSRTNLKLNPDDEDDIKTIVYKVLSDELQSIYELSTTLRGKWRKKVVEMGAEQLNVTFQKKRRDYPKDFKTIMDDEIEEGIASLRTMDGKPSDIMPILHKVNDAEYSLKFLSFVQAIKAQGSLSLKREIIQDVIKEYIVEDLNERSKTETRKLELLSQVLSKIETKESIKTIETSLNISIGNLTQIAKRAEKYFLEITSILEIPPSADDMFELLSPKSDTKFLIGESPDAAWKRLFEKYSPTKETTVSPIKQVEGNITPHISDDAVFFSLSWVLEMSEQFYFDNTLMLSSRYKNDPKAMCGVFKLNFQPFNTELIRDDYVDVVVLGSGSFGDVYRVTKKGTDELFAVKYMKKFPPGLFQAHYKMIVSFLQERNYTIAAKNSPYIVKFIQSFKIPNLNGFFLIFEWCLSDLRYFVNLLTFGDPKGISIFLWESEEGGIDQVFDKAKSKYDIDFVPVVTVYIFEIFCSLDFLAKCNIIHQDLKPENIMISNSLHLKIGDFGLVFNTKFITRPHQKYLINVSDLDYFINEPLQETFGGTELYSDMELTFKMLKHYYPDDAKELIYHGDAIEYDISSVHSDPNFLSDLWAGGIIATELLLGGTLFLYDASIDSYVLRDMGVTGNYKKVLLEITYLKGNYKQYIVEGLQAFGGDKFRQLMILIASIFQPRQVRAAGFVKEKEVYFYKKKILATHIDISKIEQIDIFKNMKLNSNNAFLFEMPKKMSTLLGKRFKVQYKTFGDLLKSTIEENGEVHEEVLDLKPGTDIQID